MGDRPGSEDYEVSNSRGSVTHTGDSMVKCRSMVRLNPVLAAAEIA
jgi:hypothetical protein